MNPCELFRARLERALRQPERSPGSVESPGLRVLGWHEHLFGCAECRALLQAEEALEVLLDALPAADLPPGLTARVLARLGTRSRDELALERDDALLDGLLDRVPAESPPQNLARRVLSGLEPERARRTELVALTMRWEWAAAALVLVGLGIWLLGRGPDHEFTVQTSGEVAQEVATDRPPYSTSEEVDADLLATLDLLENWELLLSEDVDVFLGGLGAIGELGTGTELEEEIR